MADEAGVSAWFKSIDADGSGRLDCAEIQKALALGGLQFNTSDIDSMIRCASGRRGWGQAGWLWVAYPSDEVMMRHADVVGMPSTNLRGPDL